MQFEAFRRTFITSVPRSRPRAPFAMLRSSKLRTSSTRTPSPKIVSGTGSPEWSFNATGVGWWAVRARTTSVESIAFRWPIIASILSMTRIFSDAFPSWPHRSGALTCRTTRSWVRNASIAASAFAIMSVSRPPVAPRTSMTSMPKVRNIPRISATPAIPAAVRWNRSVNGTRSGKMPAPRSTIAFAGGSPFATRARFTGWALRILYDCCVKALTAFAVTFAADSRGFDSRIVSPISWGSVSVTFGESPRPRNITATRCSVPSRTVALIRPTLSPSSAFPSSSVRSQIRPAQRPLSLTRRIWRASITAAEGPVPRYVFAGRTGKEAAHQSFREHICRRSACSKMSEAPHVRDGRLSALWRAEFPGEPVLLELRDRVDGVGPAGGDSGSLPAHVASSASLDEQPDRSPRGPRDRHPRGPGRCCGGFPRAADPSPDHISCSGRGSLRRQVCRRNELDSNDHLGPDSSVTVRRETVDRDESRRFGPRPDAVRLPQLHFRQGRVFPKPAGQACGGWGTAAYHRLQRVYRGTFLRHSI